MTPTRARRSRPDPTTTLKGIERADANLSEANAAKLATALGITAEEYPPLPARSTASCRHHRVIPTDSPVAVSEPWPLARRRTISDRHLRGGLTNRPPRPATEMTVPTGKTASPDAGVAA